MWHDKFSLFLSSGEKRYGKQFFSSIKKLDISIQVGIHYFPDTFQILDNWKNKGIFIKKGNKAEIILKSKNSSQRKYLINIKNRWLFPNGKKITAKYIARTNIYYKRMKLIAMEGPNAIKKYKTIDEFNKNFIVQLKKMDPKAKGK